MAQYLDLSKSWYGQKKLSNYGKWVQETQLIVYGDLNKIMQLIGIDSGGKIKQQEELTDCVWTITDLMFIQNYRYSSP
jgi:hypothetical protein